MVAIPTKHYATAEKHLTANGYKMEAGMPLTGVMFSNKSHLAVVFKLRNSAGYLTTIYQLFK